MYEDSDAATAAGYPGSPTADDGSAAATDYADDDNNCANGICINKGELADPSNTTLYDYLDFEASFYKDMDASVDSYMGNVYFEIPGFGSIDPYIGYGFGFSRLNYDLYIPDYDTSGNISEIKKYITVCVYINLNNSARALGLLSRALPSPETGRKQNESWQKTSDIRFI